MLKVWGEQSGLFAFQVCRSEIRINLFVVVQHGVRDVWMGHVVGRRTIRSCPASCTMSFSTSGLFKVVLPDLLTLGARAILRNRWYSRHMSVMRIGGSPTVYQGSISHLGIRTGELDSGLRRNDGEIGLRL